MKQLASTVGVTEAAISHYETGRREPDHDMLLSIANALGVTVDYLLCRESTSAPATIPAQEKAPAERRAEAKLILEQLTDEQYEAALAMLKLLPVDNKGETQ